MSIYNSKLNTIFTAVPRVASTSIHSIVGGQGHQDIIYFKRFFYGQSDLNFEKTFKFAFVRDPYTRFVSCYKWMLENKKTDKDINDFAISLKEEYKKYGDDSLEGLTFKPQWQFICNQYYDSQIDFIGKYENLSDDWSYVAGKLGIKDKLPHKNKSKKVKTILTSKTKDIIADLYQKDFETFGYDKIK